MGRSLLRGLAKGLLLGAVIGLALQLGLGWVATDTTFSLLLAMGAAATTGLITGRSPLLQKGWVEPGARAAVGLGLGALVHWALARFVGGGLPLDVLGTPEGTIWTNSPLLSVVVVCGIYGPLVELDRAAGDRRAAAAGEERLAAPGAAPADHGNTPA